MIRKRDLKNSIDTLEKQYRNESCQSWDRWVGRGETIAKLRVDLDATTKKADGAHDQLFPPRKREDPTDIYTYMWRTPYLAERVKTLEEELFLLKTHLGLVRCDQPAKAKLCKRKTVV